MIHRKAKLQSGHATSGSSQNSLSRTSERNVIKPFLGGEQAADIQDRLRSVDDFRRAEGYHPFSPRHVGVAQSKLQDSSLASDAQNKYSEQVSAGRNHHKILTVVVAVILLALAVWYYLKHG